MMQNWYDIPTYLSVALGLLGVFWPLESPRGGDYNFAPAFEVVARMAGFTILTLLIWLVAALLK